MIEMPDENGMSHIKYVKLSCEEVFARWNTPRPKLSIVDFGLTTWWKDPATDKPYPDVRKNIKNKTGTARYASLNVHRGKSHARRDDIEALGYLLLDLIFGTLPWTGLKKEMGLSGMEAFTPELQDRMALRLLARRGFGDWKAGKLSNDDFANRYRNNDNVAFAYLKATEGGDMLDDRLRENWAAARAAGVPRGAYHFYYWCRPGIEQARWFIENVPRHPSARQTSTDATLSPA